MSKPWDKELTTLTDRIYASNDYWDDYIIRQWAKSHANLERRLRHAERLIQRHLEAMDTLSGIATTLDDLYNHLEAAKKENEK